MTCRSCSTGSYGTLAALTSVILKVLPAPETEETVVLDGPRRRAGGRGHEPRHAVGLRGVRRGLSFRARPSTCGSKASRPRSPIAATSWRKAAEAPDRGDGGEKLRREVAGHPRWRDVRENPRHPLWRLSVTPSEAPAHHPHTEGHSSTSAISSTGRAASSGSRCRRRTMPRRRWCAARLRERPCDADPRARGRRAPPSTCSSRRPRRLRHSRRA